MNKSWSLPFKEFMVFQKTHVQEAVLQMCSSGEYIRCSKLLYQEELGNKGEDSYTLTSRSRQRDKGTFQKGIIIAKAQRHNHCHIHLPYCVAFQVFCWIFRGLQSLCPFDLLFLNRPLLKQFLPLVIHKQHLLDVYATPFPHLECFSFFMVATLDLTRPAF